MRCKKLFYINFNKQANLYYYFETFRNELYINIIKINFHNFLSFLTRALSLKIIFLNYFLKSFNTHV